MVRTSVVRLDHARQRIGVCADEAQLEAMWRRVVGHRLRSDWVRLCGACVLLSSMGDLIYTVTASLPDEGTSQEYVDWLLGGHVADVVAGGAVSGEVIRVLEPAEPIRVEARYLFESRDDFDRYVREVAPALRAEGLALWPGRGVSFERTVARVVG